MIPQLANALSKGFTTKQIIDLIIKKFPAQKDKIKSALSAGYTADQILKYLSGGKKELAKSEIDNEDPNTQYQKTRNTDIKRREENNQSVYNAAGTAAALAATAAAAPMAQAALSRALPKSLAPIAPTIQQTATSALSNPTGTSQPQMPTNLVSPQSSQPPISSNVQQNQPTIPQPAQTVQPEVKSINAKELLTNLGSNSKIDDLLASGNDPKTVSGYFQKFHPKIVESIEKESGQPFEKVIEQYIAELPGKENLPTEEIMQPVEETKPEPIAKGQTVATPNGVGDVKSIRNGKALVEVNGKTEQVNEEDLHQSPLPEKDLAELHDDLIKGIEKHTGNQVSRNVDYAGYDENANELLYKPHGSDKSYVYDNISPEDKELLTSHLTKRKSTGENFIGAWEAGTESPIGAAMYQLIMRLQKERGGKGNEYSKKYLTIYDAYEPAKEASKKNKAEERKKKKKGNK